MRSFEGLTSLSKGKRLVEILFISFTKKKKTMRAKLEPRSKSGILVKAKAAIPLKKIHVPH